jgi:hypothetical protein
MSIQDHIAKSLSKLKRKLYDYTIKTIGTESKVILLKIEKDQWGDEETLRIVKNSVCELFLNIPEDIPISRLRTDITQEVAKTTSTFFYDILPIEIYAKFEDNLEKGDILIKIIRTDSTNFYMVLQVTDLMGNFDNGYMTRRKYYAAPYLMMLPSEVQTIIDSYLLEMQSE